MKRGVVYYGVVCMLITISFATPGFGQSVAINADSSKADPSAILDLKSTKKGLLVPRMTVAQRDAITKPAIGLLIFQTDNTPGYYYYTGVTWTPLKTSGTGGGATDNLWSPGSGNDIFNNNVGNVGIGTDKPVSKLYLKSPLNAAGFTHLGVNQTTGRDSLVLADRLFSSYTVRNGGFTSTIPAMASFGTVTRHGLRLHAGSSGWLNIIPDGTVVIGDSAGYHGYFGSKLSVLTASDSRGISVISNNGAIVSVIGGASSSGIGTFSSSDMNIYANSTPVMTAKPSGNIGIGTATPVNKLQIGTVDSRYVGYPFAVAGSGGNSFAFNQSDAVLQFSSSTHINLVPAFGAGNVGINTNSPRNQFQIGEFANGTGYGGQAFAIAAGNDAMAININAGVTLFSASNSMLFNPQGNFGIKTAVAPANKLQIGEMGAAGYNGNDIAFGNGTQATAMIQRDGLSQIASSTDIALLPRFGSSSGRVGINTSTPRAPLDVQGLVGMTPAYGFAYYGMEMDLFKPAPSYGGTNSNADISIYASNNVLALQFDAVSDARIKNVIGISNNAKDLETVKRIQITDYTFKDKIGKGHATSKKVIAQQVEEVYPQVVSRHRDIVPNVYQLTTNIEKQHHGYRLTFAKAHNISNEAKMLEVIMNDESGKKRFGVVAIPSSTEVIIDADDLKTDRLFVYGEEVDDFRTVDYEGLTTLNISATQELSKKIEVLESALKQLQEITDKQHQQIQALMERSGRSGDAPAAITARTSGPVK